MATTFLFPIYTLKQTIEENPGIDYNDGRHVVFFNAAAYKDATSEKIKSFLEYLSTKVSKDELTDKIDNIVSSTKIKEEFGRNYMIANMRDIMMKKQAFNEGLAEGKQSSKIETARNFLMENLPLDQVARCTELPLETVEQLAKEIKQLHSN